MFFFWVGRRGGGRVPKTFACLCGVFVKEDKFGGSRIDGPSKCSLSPGPLTAAVDEVIMLGRGGGEKESPSLSKGFRKGFQSRA